MEEELAIEMIIAQLTSMEKAVLIDLLQSPASALSAIYQIRLYGAHSDELNQGLSQAGMSLINQRLVEAYPVRRLPVGACCSPRLALTELGRQVAEVIALRCPEKGFL
jgi:hypothetical protein